MMKMILESGVRYDCRDGVWFRDGLRADGEFVGSLPRYVTYCLVEKRLRPDVSEQGYVSGFSRDVRVGYRLLFMRTGSDLWRVDSVGLRVSRSTIDYAIECISNPIMMHLRDC